MPSRVDGGGQPQLAAKLYSLDADGSGADEEWTLVDSAPSGAAAGLHRLYSSVCVDS